MIFCHVWTIIDILFSSRYYAGVRAVERGKEIVKVSAVGVAVNLILAAFKAAVGFFTGSVAIIMDAVNNLSDVLSSAITIAGTYFASRGPDRDHPFGHGQIEYVTSVSVALIILIAGLAALRESVEKIIRPVETHYTVVTLVIIAVAVAAKLLLGRFVRGQGRRLNSEALIASGTDAMFDSLISLSTLAAAIIAMVWGVGIEGWLGAVIAVIMLKTGFELLMRSLGEIIGTRVDSELSVRLKEHICKFPKVLGAYDLALHRYGPERIIGSVHVEVPDEMTAREIHSLTRNLAEDVFKNYGIVLTVGIYASNTAEGKFTQMKEKLREIISDYPQIIEMHGFYVDTERMFVTFDLIIDFKADDREGIMNQVVEKMGRAYPEYVFSAVLDGDISD